MAMKPGNYTIESMFEGTTCRRCGKNLHYAHVLFGDDILRMHVALHAQNDFWSSVEELPTTSEQIQEDLRCLLDDQDQELVDKACQIVVERFKSIIRG